MASYPKKSSIPNLFIFCIDSRLFLLACLVGFVFCILQGYLISNHNYIYTSFIRFNTYLTGEKYYYPTIRQFRSLTCSKISNHHQVLVIIGGDSILNGVGQSCDKLWSKHLQELLGKQFVVVNLSMCGAPPTGAGECLAEYFAKTGVPVVFIGDIGRFDMSIPDGGSVYRYVYWQAYYGGFLFDNNARVDMARSQDTGHEQEIHGFLSEYLRFDDMWSHITYRYGSIVWLPPSDFPWWSSRRVTEGFDTDKGDQPPVSVRFKSENPIELAKAIASNTESYYVIDSSNQWKPVQAVWAKHEKEFLAVMVPEMRKRTLWVFVEHAPYFYKFLSPSELLRENLYEKDWNADIKSLGFITVTEKNFLDEDFHDRAHLAPSGGRKLAECQRRDEHRIKLAE